MNRGPDGLALDKEGPIAEKDVSREEMMIDAIKAKDGVYVVFERSPSGDETLLGGFATAGEAFKLVDQRKELKLELNHRVTRRPIDSEIFAAMDKSPPLSPEIC
jgi:hypothetical protein